MERACDCDSGSTRPKPRARRASAWPMRPMPTMPMRLPSSRPPSIAVGLQPVHLPARTRRSPAPMRRAVASTSAIVMSAVSSVSTPGVLVTVMPRWRAVSRSMWSTPVPNEAISFSRGPAWHSTRLSMRSVTVGTSTSAVLTASTSSGGGHRLVVGIQPRVEQLHQPRLDRAGQGAGDDHQRLFLRDGRHPCPDSNSARRLSSRAPQLSECRKARRFQVLVVGCAEMRYKGGNANSTVRSPLGGLCCVDACWCGPAQARRSPRRLPSARARACRIPRFASLRPTRSMSAPGRARAIRSTGCSSARACRSRSSPSTRTGGKSAIGRAPAAGSTRAC